MQAPDPGLSLVNFELGLDLGQLTLQSPDSSVLVLHLDLLARNLLLELFVFRLRLQLAVKFGFHLSELLLELRS